MLLIRGLSESPTLGEQLLLAANIYRLTSTGPISSGTALLAMTTLPALDSERKEEHRKRKHSHLGTSRGGVCHAHERPGFVGFEMNTVLGCRFDPLAQGGLDPPYQFTTRQVTCLTGVAHWADVSAKLTGL